MADQQFLASFGVDIDESGVSRLQKILTENRTLADSLSASFDAASESVKAFRESVSEDFPTLFSGSGYGNVTENLFGDYTGLKIGLNMTEPKKEIAAFTESAKKPIPLSANASSIVSAARTAMEQVRSLFSETFILNVRANSSTDSSSKNDNSRTDSRNKDETGSAFLRMSSGGRFSRPTSVQVAEDGDAEYIIPVKKENKALPLLRQLLSELSPSARQSLNAGNSWDDGTKGTVFSVYASAEQKEPIQRFFSLHPPLAAAGETPAPFREVPGISLPSAVQPTAHSVTNTSNNVSAPVTINVNASGVDAGRIGQSIYDTAERYLLRTLRGAYS